MGLTNTVQCIVLLFCWIVKDGMTNNQSYFYVQNSHLKILNYNYDSVYIILTVYRFKKGRTIFKKLYSLK